MLQAFEDNMSPEMNRSRAETQRQISKKDLQTGALSDPSKVPNTQSEVLPMDFGSDVNLDENPSQLGDAEAESDSQDSVKRVTGKSDDRLFKSEVHASSEGSYMMRVNDGSS